MSPRDPLDELKASQASITPVSDETRAGHLLAIDEALADRVVVPFGQRVSVVLRWAAAAVVIAGVLLPSAIVVAADSLPGDALYSVKRATEPLLAVFDSEVVARHRINEVVDLRLQDRPADKALEDATRAVDDLPSDSPLRDQLTDLSPTTTTTTTPAPADTDATRTKTRTRTTTTPQSSTSTTASTRPPTDRTTTTVEGDTETDR